MIKKQRSGRQATLHLTVKKLVKTRFRCFPCESLQMSANVNGRNLDGDGQVLVQRLAVRTEPGDLRGEAWLWACRMAGMPFTAIHFARTRTYVRPVEWNSVVL